MMSYRFDEKYWHNLALLEKRDSLLAFHLRLMQSPSPTFQKKSRRISLHLDKIDVLYLYGLEEANHYPLYQSWLHQKKERFLIFFEDDLSKVQLFLLSSHAQKILEDKRVFLFFLSPNFNHALEEALKRAIWPYLFKPFHFESVDQEDKERRERGRAIHALLSELRMGAELTFSLYRDFGVRHMTNVLQNFLEMRTLQKGEELKGAFQGIPALICGAGPSLAENLKEIKQSHQHALLFVGGSALTYLSQQNACFHFGGSIDPFPPPQRFLRQTAFTTPFFYQNQFSHELLSAVHGPKICFGDSGGFPLERWFLDSLDLSLSPFEAGWNISTFLTHVAAYLGCNPIIFVGVDFAREKGQTYSKGVEEAGEEEWQRDDPISVVDRLGRKTATRADFFMGKRWIEDFCKENPHIQFFTASHGGLFLEGVEYKGFKELLCKEIAKKSDLESLVHQKIQQLSTFCVHKENVLESIKKIKQSHKKCGQLVQEILFRLEKEGCIEEKIALELFELERELFCTELLLPLWEVWKHLLIQKVDPQMDLMFVQKVLFFQEVIKSYEEGNVFLSE